MPVVNAFCHFGQRLVMPVVSFSGGGGLSAALVLTGWG
jgi:hypothetical protein